MFKFVVLSALLAVAQADVDKFLGKAVTIGVSPYAEEYGDGCFWYTVSKVNGVECNCEGGIKVPLISFKHESGSIPEEFLAADEVKTYAEGIEAANVGKCKCGDKDYPVLAFKEINDNYYFMYSKITPSKGPITTMLSVKTLPTQADLDETVGKIDELKSSTDSYKVFCGLH